MPRAESRGRSKVMLDKAGWCVVEEGMATTSDNIGLIAPARGSSNTKPLGTGVVAKLIPPGVLCLWRYRGILSQD